MNVLLSENAERFVRERIESGEFRSGDEVVDFALRRLERDMAIAPASPGEAEFEGRLIADGLLNRVPPARERSTARPFEPIRIEGEPLSETVIRERR